MTLTKLEAMDGHSLNNGEAETIVSAGDDTPADRDRRIPPVKDAPMVRRKPDDAGADDKTASYPRMPSQWAVDVAYMVQKLGRLTAAVAFMGLGSLVMVPWIGTNVVIPAVNSATKFIENMSISNTTWAETGKSLSVIAVNSTKMQSDMAEDRKHQNALLESAINRIDAKLGTAQGNK